MYLMHADNLLDGGITWAVSPFVLNLMMGWHYSNIIKRGRNKES